jgi:hypothetical protein
MPNGYTPEHKRRAKDELDKAFEMLCKHDFGKIEINFNRQAAMIEIVPQPHIRLKAKK